ncbi:MAG: hypothetical protein O3C67_08720 [Cyanobacteria bacterium]|nr:hypothetical protein [Cyanobacteriota bacterium]MDA0866681.1 hypothetical protein [Cyanobacteriota bacterium]MEB3268389.1 hypothetical protein [Leptolyngbya sp.]
MLNTSLIQGLEITLVVSLMAIVVSPILCWVLPDRIHPTPEETIA